jgi:catechol 2,3-dioxygenase-like lactoylglutathione lyase family enzyme
MTIQRMEHVGIVVDDLAAATAFFVELGLKLQGDGPVEGGWVDRVVGLEGVRAEIAMVETLCVPKTSSTSCDQAIFVDQATVSPSPDAVLAGIDRVG